MQLVSDLWRVKFKLVMGTLIKIIFTGGWNLFDQKELSVEFQENINFTQN